MGRNWSQLHLFTLHSSLAVEVELLSWRPLRFGLGAEVLGLANASWLLLNARRNSARPPAYTVPFRGPFLFLLQAVTLVMFCVLLGDFLREKEVSFLEHFLLALVLHRLRDSDCLGSLGWRGFGEVIEEAIRVCNLENRSFFASLDARPDIVLRENEMVRLDLLEDRELEVGVWEFLEDVDCQAEHCISLLPRRHLGVCVLGFPPQGVSSVLGQNELGGFLDAGVATTFVGFWEPHLLCAYLVEEVFGDHWVI